MIKKGDVLEKVRIENVAAEGKCLSRINNQVVFIKGMAPGDLVDLKVIKKRKSFLEAVPTQVHEYSSKRTEPFCTHFGICGGCKWQHLNYPSQLEFKQQQVEDQLVRLGKLSIPEILPIIPSENTRYYRNKLEYTFSTGKWFTREEIDTGEELDNRALGFHLPGRFDRILDIDTCYLQDDLSNKIRNQVQAKALELNMSFYDVRSFSGTLRNLILRNTTTGEWMVILQIFQYDEKVEELLHYLKQEFPEITSLNYVVNTKKNETFHDLEVVNYHGRDHIIEQMGDLKFRIGPKSFFQTNTHQAIQLYDKVKEFSELSDNDVVYDLYSGTGTITNYIAKEVKSVVGLEYVEDAVRDAYINSELNGIENTSFQAGDIKNLLKPVSIDQKPNLIITDPPRAGMHAEVVQSILDLGAEKVVYVSCNPATQARDLSLLNEKYTIEKVQPVDMFPHTAHVENIVQLKIR